MSLTGYIRPSENINVGNLRDKNRKKKAFRKLAYLCINGFLYRG